ncbi:putative LPS assembly protein LptD [Daejeonella sp. H1SJ63]|uniref:putative LPS assembly protein LptD n=1 Tax=Daejeonella sp. H1SJ63 TaxID=3034145 RepID=UPI0023ED4321|nr:putative LPS assembly protein LptD [Daejeonella sp. H1SJ63]
MKFIRPIFIYFSVVGYLVLGSVIPSNAQQPRLRPDNASSGVRLRSDTVKTDTVTKKINKSASLNSKVTYSAEDSIIADMPNNIVFLYGKAKVKYEDFELEADYIRLDQKNNSMFASGLTDPKTKKYNGKPLLTQGSEPPLTTDSLFFNYKTKKGKSYGVFTDVEGGFLQANQFKKNEYDEGFFKKGIYSTCNLPHPHFGIHITRGIATDKQIITGPAFLVIEDIPLPLGVPFGFFPKPNRRSGGLLFPTFGEDTRGFFMRDLGYYLGLNDYWDLSTRGTLYSKGSYELGTSARYRKNYKYDGNLNFRFASTKNGVEGTSSYKTPNKDFNLTWSHTQSPLANPGTTFSASVNAGTGSYFSNSAAAGTYNPIEMTRNTLSSSISYGKVFANGLFNFSSSLSHRQDIQQQSVYLELPNFSLNMTTINPFDSKDRTGEQKWYQRLSLGYSMQGRNSIDTKEYKLFRKESLKDFKNGIQHDIPISLSFNVLKYFQLTSGIQYSEKWFLQTFRKRLNPVASGFDMVTDTIQGFSRAYDYNMSSGLATKLYGKFNFKKGNLMAIRHVMTPTVNFNYRPDFGSSKYGYFRNIQGDTSRLGDRYSIYGNTVFSAPSAGRVAGIGFSVDNNVEAKVRSTADSSKNSVNIPILQSLSFSGNYNFAAEYFKLSTIGFSGRTAFFKEKIGVNFYGTLDPYKIDADGNRINKYTIESGKLARLTNFGLSTDFSLNSKSAQKRNENLKEIDGLKQGLSREQQAELNAISRDPNAFVDFNIPWNVSAAYSFNYSTNGLQSSISNTLNFFGDFNVTPKWKVQYTSGYDFQLNKLSLTQFSIYRDLHCWDLSFRWSPLGTYKFYSVDLRVKASILQDLKLSKRRDFYNNF